MKGRMCEMVAWGGVLFFFFFSVLLTLPYNMFASETKFRFTFLCSKGRQCLLTSCEKRGSVRAARQKGSQSVSFLSAQSRTHTKIYSDLSGRLIMLQMIRSICSKALYVFPGKECYLKLKHIKKTKHSYYSSYIMKYL